MTIQKRMRWRDYAEAYPCEECGNPPSKASWREHNAWVEEHAAWHREATAGELRKHEEAEKRGAWISNALLEELRPLDLVRPFMRVALHTEEPKP